MKYLVALDIDGTITDQNHFLPQETADYFADLHAQGIGLLFVTGRTFFWGYQVLHHLKIPYYFSVQNGALMLKMPERKIVERKYLNRNIFSTMDEICLKEKTDYVIYSGYENHDICYFRPHKFETSLLHYVKKRASHIGENWIEVSDFDHLIDSFASIKCFATSDNAQRISDKIQKRLFLNAPVNRDPFNSNYFVIQATQQKVTKGEAIFFLKKEIPEIEIVIGAGDDENDIPLFQASDFKIVMGTAPQNIKNMANLIAAPSSEQGIIQALKIAFTQI